MAITGVTYEPQDYRTVYNPIEYVATSNQTATARFKYLFDVYDGATLLGRLKVPADPNGYGRSNIQGICESYLTTNLGNIDTTTTGRGFTDNIKSYKEFTVKIGEEYEVGGVLVPDPDQVIKTVITFNGSLPNYRGDVLNFYDWQTNNYYLNYTDNAINRKWLTNAPKGSGANKSDNQKVQITDEGWLYFLLDHATDPIEFADITAYDSSGAIVSINSITNAIGSTSIKMLKIPFAPNTINNIIPSDFVGTITQPIITSSVTSYKIILKTSSAQVSEEIWFNIDSECRYEVRRLEFLNSLGGFDAFNFTKVSRRTEQIERSFYKQNPDNMSSGVIDYNISDRQKVQYYTKSMPKMKLTSDWVDVATFNWLLEMIESPEVYLYENGQRVAIQNIEGNWEEKRSDTDSVFNLEVTLEFGMDNYRQRY
jgi:hypothetical protein